MLQRILLLILIVCSPAAAAQPTLMVLGDSLSAAYGMKREQGWVSLLERRLQEAGYRYRVVNASISGDTTQGGLSRLGPALERHAPDILIVELGGNDGLRGISPAAMRENLDAILSRGKQAGAEVVLVGVSLPPNYGAAFNERFMAVYRELAEQHQVPLVLLSLQQVAEREGMIQDDGIHPTAAAQGLILDLVWDGLKGLLGEPAES